ncbi:hypothetical protein DF17_27545 [Streptomyces rimosus]|nr:hypothetical protein DF17_27545 [Streptomyces rimosus]KUJ32363.1 hypothetical protein ADK46_22725 [Streptomyces rimosus subsp. rimosus]
MSGTVGFGLATLFGLAQFRGLFDSECSAGLDFLDFDLLCQLVDLAGCCNSFGSIVGGALSSFGMRLGLRGGCLCIASAFGGFLRCLSGLAGVVGGVLRGLPGLPRVICGQVGQPLGLTGCAGRLRSPATCRCRELFGARGLGAGLARETTSSVCGAGGRVGVSARADGRTRGLTGGPGCHLYLLGSHLGFFGCLCCRVRIVCCLACGSGSLGIRGCIRGRIAGAGGGCRCTGCGSGRVRGSPGSHARRSVGGLRRANGFLSSAGCALGCGCRLAGGFSPLFGFLAGFCGLPLGLSRQVLGVVGCRGGAFGGFLGCCGLVLGDLAGVLGLLRELGDRGSLLISGPGDEHADVEELPDVLCRTVEGGLGGFLDSRTAGAHGLHELQALVGRSCRVLALIEELADVLGGSLQRGLSGLLEGAARTVDDLCDLCDLIGFQRLLPAFFQEFPEVFGGALQRLVRGLVEMWSTNVIHPAYVKDIIAERSSVRADIEEAAHILIGAHESRLCSGFHAGAAFGPQVDHAAAFGRQEVAHVTDGGRWCFCGHGRGRPGQADKKRHGQEAQAQHTYAEPPPSLGLRQVELVSHWLAICSVSNVLPLGAASIYALSGNRTKQ